MRERKSWRFERLGLVVVLWRLVLRVGMRGVEVRGVRAFLVMVEPTGRDLFVEGVGFK